MHLSHMFKKIGGIGRSVFGLARQPKAPAEAPASAPAATEQPTLHDATSNAGDAVVNFQSLKQPTAQQQKAAGPGPTPMGNLNG